MMNDPETRQKVENKVWEKLGQNADGNVSRMTLTRLIMEGLDELEEEDQKRRLMK